MFYLLTNVLKLCVFVLILMFNPFTLVIGSLYFNIMFYLLGFKLVLEPGY